MAEGETKKKSKGSSSSSEASMFERLAPVMLVVVIGLAFAVGVLWQKVNNLEGGSTPTRVAGTDTNTGTQPAAQPPTNGKLSESEASKLAEITAEDYVLGDRNAEVFLIEYSDLECPFCKSFHETAAQAVEDNGGRVAWVYRHFPLDAIHPNARPAAVASECVGELGGNDAFWNYTNEIFTNQATALSDLSGTAGIVGVNAGSVESCIDSGRTEDLVEDDYQSGLAAGVTGTPGNFVVNANGEVWSLPGAVPITTLQATIDEALGN